MPETHESLVREFPVELSEDGDGRTLEARIVPFNKKARVADPPSFEFYDEEFLPGAFERQTKAPHSVKVWLNFEHEQGLRGIVGHGIELEERDDALYGTFRVHENADGDKALAMVRDGLLTGLSLEFNPLRSRRVQGVVQRVRAHLDRVSLVRVGAYEDARVLALREEQPEPDDGPDAPDPTPEQPSPTPPAEPAPPVPVAVRNSAVDELLERVGYKPMLKRAVVDKAWNGAAARFEDDEYERSCLLCRPGDESPKTRCSLPVLEPNGDLNVQALGAAAARLNQLTDVTMAQKAAAARKLIRYYRQANKSAPPMVVAMAGRR